jgi:hypothetical protein
MRNIIAPLIRFAEEPFGLTRGSIEQFRQRLGDQFVELSLGRHYIVESRRENLTVSHSLSIR